MNGRTAIFKIGFHRAWPPLSKNKQTTKPKNIVSKIPEHCTNGMSICITYLPFNMKNMQNRHQVAEKRDSCKQGNKQMGWQGQQMSLESQKPAVHDVWPFTSPSWPPHGGESLSFLQQEHFLLKEHLVCSPSPDIPAACESIMLRSQTSLHPAQEALSRACSSSWGKREADSQEDPAFLRSSAGLAK